MSLSRSAGLLLASGLPLALLSPAPASAQPVKATGAVVVVSSGRDWAMAAKVLEEVRRVKKIPKARFVFFESGMPAEPPPEELKAFLKRIRSGRKLIFKLKLAPAIERLESVSQELRAAIRKYGATPGLMRRLMQASSYLGAAHQLNADAASAKKAFAVMLAIDPGRGLSPKYFSPEVIQAFEQVRAGLSKAGVLRVQTDKPAFVFVDGWLRGVAPKEIKNLTPGDHVVELRRLGAVRVTRHVTVDEQSGATLRATLVEAPDRAELRKTLKAVDRELRRKGTPGPAMAALAKALGVRHVVACRASLDDGEASWYDAQSNAFVKRVRRLSAVPGTPAARVIAQAMRQPTPALDLQAGSGATGGRCDDSGDCPGGTCVSGRCVSETPIYKKWWFWTLIGLGVAAVAGGATGLALMPERPTIRITLGGR